jgi:hypothetical protein
MKVLIGAFIAGAAAVAAALGATCYVSVSEDCCALSTLVPGSRDCTHQSPCVDTLVSSGEVTHNREAYPNEAGFKSFEAGASCTCTLKTRTCSAQGYCVLTGNTYTQYPIPEAATGEPCTGGEGEN